MAQLKIECGGIICWNYKHLSELPIIMRTLKDIEDDVESAKLDIQRVRNDINHEKMRIEQLKLDMAQMREEMREMDQMIKEIKDHPQMSGFEEHQKKSKIDRIAAVLNMECEAEAEAAEEH